LAETSQQLDLGLLGVLLSLKPAVPLANPLAVLVAAEVEYDAIAVAALND
jgi:hypothetical protein